MMKTYPRFKLPFACKHEVRFTPLDGRVFAIEELVTAARLTRIVLCPVCQTALQTANPQTAEVQHG